MGNKRCNKVTVCMHQYYDLTYGTWICLSKDECIKKGNIMEKDCKDELHVIAIRCMENKTQAMNASITAIESIQSEVRQEVEEFIDKYGSIIDASYDDSGISIGCEGWGWSQVFDAIPRLVLLLKHVLVIREQVLEELKSL